MGILMNCFFHSFWTAGDAFWKLIENERVSIAVRMMQMLSMGHHLQRNINAGQLFGLEHIYEHYLSDGAAVGCRLSEG